MRRKYLISLAAGLLCLCLTACEEKPSILKAEPITASGETSGADLGSTGKAAGAENDAKGGDKKNAKGESGADGEKTTRSASSEENIAADAKDSLQGTPLTEGTVSTVNLLQKDGTTLETRVQAPSGYERVEVEEGSFEEFLRQYPMKPDGAKVHLYDGSEKGNQSAHVAVFDLPIEDYDLQQCADSVMRMYAEYFWATEQYDRIKFHFTNGFLVEYTKWRDGNRITVSGNNVSWIKSKSKDTSYDCFVRYLKTIFCYAGTLSMEKESEPTLLSLLKAGDVFLYGGSPGHVVMVVDACVNEEGKKAFLLAQGYMPAQEFHLLKNNLHPEDPWYYEDEITFPFDTPEYVFQEGSMRSLSYDQ
jgi:hypothetical protein